MQIFPIDLDGIMTYHIYVFVKSKFLKVWYKIPVFWKKCIYYQDLWAMGHICKFKFFSKTACNSMILLQTLGGTLVSLSQISRGYLACFGKHHESWSVFNPVWYAQNVFRGPSFGFAFFQRRTFRIYGHPYEPEASNWRFSATSGDFLRHSGNTSVSWRGHAICLRSRQTTLHQHISRY